LLTGGIWDWRIAVYLFLGGITAGIMCFSAWAVLANKEQQAPFTTWRLALWGPILLSLGMTTLFLDLEHKLYVFRFYTTFRLASPMSYGAWILIFVYPAAIALILATLRQGYPLLASWVERIPMGGRLLGRLMDWAERHRRPIAAWNIPFDLYRRTAQRFHGPVVLEQRHPGSSVPGLWPLHRQNQIGVDTLADWILQGRRDFVLLDVRSQRAFAAGHIQSAQSMPLTYLVERQTMTRLPRDRMLVLYSNGNREAAQAVVMLRLAGLDAYALLEGYELWSRHELGRVADHCDYRHNEGYRSILFVRVLVVSKGARQPGESMRRGVGERSVNRASRVDTGTAGAGRGNCRPARVLNPGRI
jgi:rhodanese-related sulfurtransferase